MIGGETAAIDRLSVETAVQAKAGADRSMGMAGWQRDLDSLAAKRLDLLIVGGGIHGVALAAEAARSGLVTALVEAHDFGHATSAASLRIMHGGLRYLQHLDLRRMRQSIAARRDWLSHYPELVRPMAFQLPTEGHGLRGPAVHRVAMALNDLISFDANRGLPAADALPRSGMLGRAERERILDHLALPGANGMARWHDGIILDSERLLLAVLDEAVAAGALVANHLRAVRLLTEDRRVTGVELQDRLDGGHHVLEAPQVVDTSGPWTGGWTGVASTEGRFVPSRAFNLLTRRLDLPGAVGLPLPDHAQDQDEVFKKGAKTCFILPWGDYSLIGTHHLPARADGGRRVRPAEVQALVRDINGRLKKERIGEGDVLRVFDGVLPANAPGGVSVKKSPLMVDHGKAGGPAGLFTVVGVKWTTARTVARTALSLLGTRPSPETRHGSARQPQAARDRRTLGLEAVCRAQPSLAAALPGGKGTRGAEIAWAAREEMAMTLADVVFRRTGLGLATDCALPTLQAAARIMADVHGWSESRSIHEVDDVEAELDRLARQAGRPLPVRASASTLTMRAG